MKSNHSFSANRRALIASAMAVLLGAATAVAGDFTRPNSELTTADATTPDPQESVSASTPRS